MIFKRKCIFFIFVFIMACSQKSEHHWHGQTMGTYYRIKVLGSSLSDDELLKLKTDVDKLLKETNRQMSTYIKDSEISLFNKAQVAQKVSPLFYQTADEALQISKLTKGAFDPTVGPLVNLWGFGPEGKRNVPEQSEIDKELKRVGHQYLVLKNGNQIDKKKDVYLDLSAIAKGKGVDVISDFLREQGHSDHLVEIGGEIKVSGRKGKKFWQIGIETPNKELGQSVQLVVPMSNMAMATSGNYRNFYKAKGKTYAHTIDPRSGTPVAHNLASVSVIHPLCSQADGLATAIMVLGDKKGFEFATENKLKAYFIYYQADEFKTKMTPAFKSYKEEMQR